MSLFEGAKARYMLFDGAMGTMLQRRGLKPGAQPELLNLTDAELVTSVHRAYVEVGADIITANTFQANRQKMPADVQIKDVIGAGIKCARDAGANYVALDIGPLGKMMAPMGMMTFDDAYDQFKEQMVIGAQAGADLILIETMSDLYEVKAAVLAAKENTKLPVICTMTFEAGGRTFLGVDAAAAALTISALGVDAFGANCSMGPDDLAPVVREILKYCRVPVLVQANAGLPDVQCGEAHYSVSPESYADAIERMAADGVAMFGGCCGTDPDYIRAIKERLLGKAPAAPNPAPVTAIASPRGVLVMTDRTTVIGERINPTGNEAVREALEDEEYDDIVSEAIDQQAAGADAIDVNCGLPGIDEPAAMAATVRSIQEVCRLPLVIDSADPRALECGVRAANGRPIINSVTGKQISLDSVLPIAKKYGAALICLTMDEQGIPDTAEGRIAIAKRIIAEAETYGIPAHDLIIDCLALPAAAEGAGAMETVRAIGMVKDELGLLTTLGVSNVSFGLPNRDALNGAYLAMALGAGLSAPIMNPLSARAMETVRAARLLSGEDRDAVDYIKNAAK